MEDGWDGMEGALFFVSYVNKTSPNKPESYVSFWLWSDEIQMSGKSDDIRLWNSYLLTTCNLSVAVVLKRLHSRPAAGPCSMCVGCTAHRKL